MTIFRMSFTASLLILAAVIIRAIFMHKVPKRIFYVMWGIILCRLLIPVTIPSRFSAYTMFNRLSNTLTAAQPVNAIHPAASSRETTVINGSPITTAPDQTPDPKYRDYGITYDQDSNMLLNGEMIRYFEDSVKLDENSAATYYASLNPEGIIDVYTTREATKNSDGSSNLMGKLTGIKKRSLEEFDALDINSLKDQQYTAAVSEASENDISYSSSDNTQTSTAVDSEEEAPLSPEEREELYSLYKPFGVSYDKEKDELYYQGKLVYQLWDIISTNGEGLSSGYFSGTIRTVGSENGEISLKTIRDYTKPDADGYGKLIGIEIDTENN